MGCEHKVLGRSGGSYSLTLGILIGRAMLCHSQRRLLPSLSVEREGGKDVGMHTTRGPWDAGLPLRVAPCVAPVVSSSSVIPVSWRNAGCAGKVGKKFQCPPRQEDGRSIRWIGSRRDARGQAGSPRKGIPVPMEKQSGVICIGNYNTLMCSRLKWCRNLIFGAGDRGKRSNIEICKSLGLRI